MNTIKSLPLGLLVVLAMSCSKEKDSSISTDPEFSASSFSELNVSPTFDWSSSVKGAITVVVEAPSGLYTEGNSIELQDSEGNILDRSTIANGEASFYISTPQEVDGLYAYYPYTQQRVELDPDKSSAVLTLEQIDFESDLNNDFFVVSKSATRKSVTSSNMVIQGDFENANLLLDNSSYTTLRQIGAWYSHNNSGTIATMSGSKVFTSSSTSQDGKIFQSFSIGGDQYFDFSYEFGGNAGFYVLFFDGSKRYVGHTRVTISGNQANANFLAPDHVKYIQIYGFAGSNEWLDNVSLSEIPETDSDNDGVVDRKDNYPNDPQRAYASYFPQVGEQILAFEDLWPYNGDNDFNDAVLANHIEFSLNANKELVDAKISVTINALGAGLKNGVGLAFYDKNKIPFNSQIISSVSYRSESNVGQIDPDVLNGFIVTNNLLEAIGNYYTNTGNGPTSAPKTLEFTIEFKQGVGNLTIIPDFYIFRTDDRGKEIHLPGFRGTEGANTAYYNTGHDVNGTYRNAKGLPWAIEIIYPYSLHFKHPLEKIDIVDAYPQFKAWASSNGTKYKGWMLYPDNSKVFQQ